MNSIVEIIVSGNTSGATVAGGTLDLYGDESIQLNLSIRDIRDVTSTVSSYSQNFQIPGTKNNRQIFQDLHLIGVDGNFDPRKKANCSVYVDTLPIIDGSIQVVSIEVNDRDVPIYNVTVFGGTKGFNSAIEGKYLTDYNWSELNHVLNVNNIANSWSSTTSSLGYYYSLKDFGYDYTIDSVKGKVQSGNIKPGIPFGNMYPDISAKYIMDKIFSAAGYSFESNFLSSSTFTELVHPYNGDPNTIMGSEYVSGRTFVATNSTLSSTTLQLSAYTISPYAIQPYTYDYEYRIRANVILSGVNSNVTTAYTQSLTGDTYTFDQPAISSFSFGVNYEYMTLPNAIRGQVGCRFYRSGYNNGLTPFYEDLSIEEQVGVGYRIFMTPVCDVTETSFYQSQTLKPFAAGEKVWASVFFRINLGYVPPASTLIPFKITEGGIIWKHYPSPQRTSGQLVNFNNIIPKNVLVTDYLKSIFNMFNCYLEPSRTSNNRFIIEPFEGFYGNGSQRDWSTKLDRSQPVTEMLISEELAKQYKFTYTEDNDWLNQDYKNKTNEIYGQLTWDVENEFTTNEEEVKIMFAPTPVDNIVGSDQFVIPKIGKYASNGSFGKVEHKLRILRKNPTLTKLPTGEYFRFTGSTTYTSYPYAGHLNHPFSGSIDYNFGSVPKVYYPFNVISNNSITENNMINLYWKKYLDEITDKESKFVTAYFKLTPNDISTFRFADTVYVEGLSSEGGHWFRVNSIEYSLNSSNLAKVELVKVLNKYTSNRPSKFLVATGTPVLFNGGLGSISLQSAKVRYPGSIGIGEGVLNEGINSLAMGQDNIIGGGSDNSIIIGQANSLLLGSTGSTTFGYGNTAYTSSIDSKITGNYNRIKNGSEKITVQGDSNFISFTNKGRIVGDNNVVDINEIYSSEKLNINGYGNITYGQSTGFTTNGNENAIFGGTSNTTVNGSSNTTIGTSGIFLNGDLNYAQSVEQTNVNGNSNNLLGGVSINLNGSGNSVDGGVQLINITGNDNEIYSTTSGITLNGNENSVGNNTYDVHTTGYKNYIQAYVDGKYSVVHGSGNTFYASNSYVRGIGNYVAVSPSTGDNIKIDGTLNFVFNTNAPSIHGDNNSLFYSDRVNINGINNYISEVTASTINGYNNTLLSASTLSILGSGNTVHNTRDVIIHGDLNEVYTGATYVTIFGKNNLIGSATTNSLINGNDNIIPAGSQNVSIMGLDAWSASSNDITYMNNSYVDTVLYMSNTSSSEQANGIAGGDVANAFGSGGTASGDYSFTCGYNNVASGYSSFASGGYSEAVGVFSFVYGQGNSVSGDSSFAGGEFCSNEKNFGFITGKETVGNRYAEWARASAGNYGQYGSVQAFGTTAASGSSNLYLSISSDIFTIESNTSYMFKVRATAADYAFTSSGYSACFEGSCLLKNVGGTVSSVGSLTNQLYADGILSSSTLTLAADNTNKGLSIVGSSGIGPGMIWSVEVDYVKVKHNPL